MTITQSYCFFDDIEIGSVYESAARTVTESDIVTFAGFSGDYNPIHIDHEFAKTTPFRKPIAHGFAVFSIASGLSIHAPLTKTVALIGVREWTFANPVFIGDTIHVRSTVLEKHIKGIGKRGEIVWKREIINQHGKIVQHGLMMTMVEARPKS
jgi:acyl dehydratase